MAHAQALEILRPRDEYRQLFADMIACFKAFDLRVIGSLHNAILVQRMTFPYSDVFAVSDNGGEVNVERVNDKNPVRSLPYTRHGFPIDGATLAYRVRCGVDDDSVDYSITHRDDLAFLVAFGRE